MSKIIDFQLDAKAAMDFCIRAFRIPRSIVSQGNLDSMSILQSFLIPNIDFIDIPSGTDFNGWTVPNEWNLVSASLVTPSGEELIDLEQSNLYVMVGSQSIDGIFDLEELLSHIHTRSDLPSAIPYVTSYYSKTWGICLPYSAVEKLKEGDYRVRVNTTTPPGVMRLGEIFIPGREDYEVFFSTYFCHPQMANNELSGPAVWMSLANSLWEMSLKNELRYSYRFYIGPETIGAIHYLNARRDEISKSIVAGYVLTCVGVDSDLVFMPSRSGITLADRVAELALVNYEFKRSDFLKRGSDERQWCSPAINWPVCSVMTSKYHDYPEYHTSLDDLAFISEAGFSKSIKYYSEVIYMLERNRIYINNNVGEPKLDSFGLYPTVNKDGNTSHLEARNILNILNLLDGKTDTIQICKSLSLNFGEVEHLLDKLYAAGVISL
jgi:aminopeptidase-like protein